MTLARDSKGRFLPRRAKPATAAPVALEPEIPSSASVILAIGWRVDPVPALRRETLAPRPAPAPLAPVLRRAVLAPRPAPGALLGRFWRALRRLVWPAPSGYRRALV